MKDLAGEINSVLHDPRLLEEFYQRSVEEGKKDEFISEIDRLYELNPEDRLLSAWYFRFHTNNPKTPGVIKVNWTMATSLSVLLGLILGTFTQQALEIKTMLNLPLIFLFWAPLTAIALAFYLFADNQKQRNRAVVLTIFLALISAFVYYVVNYSPASVWGDSGYASHYLNILILHLPILSWLGLGFALLKPKDQPSEFSAYFLKSAEVILLTAIFGVISSLFIAMATGIFGTLGFNFDEQAVRWIFPFIFGLLPIVCVALVYVPGKSPNQQNFQQGIARIIPSVGMFFILLMLILQLLFLLALPFNFRQPFIQREVLLVYNLFLFFSLLLLFLGTPRNIEYLSSRAEKWLSGGLLLMSASSMLISLYALSAVIYRIYYFDSITLNRFTLLGWNLINIMILGMYLYFRLKKEKAHWILSTQKLLRLTMMTYIVWCVFLLVLAPILF